MIAMKKRMLFVMVAALLTLIAQTPLSAKQKVLIYGDKSYPPYSFQEGSQAKGIYVEVLQAAFSKMPDYEVTIKQVPWKKGIAAVKKGKAVGLFPPYFSEKRTSWMLYSEPILQEKTVVFGKAENLAGKTRWPEDFAGAKIGLNRGFAPELLGGNKFEAMIASGKIHKEEADGNKQNLKKLNAGRIDFYLSDQFIDTHAFPAIKKGVVANTNYGYVGFTKKTDTYTFIPDFKRQFDKILQEMKESGEIERIIKKYIK